MMFFDAIREMAAGFKFGARHSFSQNHNLTAKAIQPSVSHINDENFGR